VFHTVWLVTQTWVMKALLARLKTQQNKLFYIFLFSERNVALKHQRTNFAQQLLCSCNSLGATVGF